MRLRAIYFRERRVLVVIGKKKIAPHSIFDVFGASMSDADFGEIASGRTTAHLALSEAKSGSEFGQENDALVTDGILLPLSKGGIGIEQKADANAHIVRFGHVHGDILADHETKALPTESVLASVNSGISASNETPALETESVFDKAESGIGTISSGDAIKTEVAKFDDAESGMASSENNSTFNNGSPIYGKAEESINFGENVEAEIEKLLPITIGRYRSRTDIAESVLEGMSINISIKYINTDNQWDYANSLLFNRRTDGLVILADATKYFGTWNRYRQEIILNTYDRSFWVLQDAEVPKANHDLFYRYFQLV